MEIIPEQAVVAACALPRFADGTINMQELLRQLAESVVNEIIVSVNLDFPRITMPVPRIHGGEFPTFTADLTCA
ncbi:MAG: hypothetical protein DUD35_14305 [Lactobacillus sp.]|nr:MAG: hypothetical protein DUD35_14305 [Lactobacillus sp.]